MVLAEGIRCRFWTFAFRLSTARGPLARVPPPRARRLAWSAPGTKGVAGWGGGPAETGITGYRNKVLSISRVALIRFCTWQSLPDLITFLGVAREAAERFRVEAARALIEQRRLVVALREGLGRRLTGLHFRQRPAVHGLPSLAPRLALAEITDRRSP
jgi:hypothetical protein